MEENSLRALKEVHWSFSEPVWKSLEEFIAAVDDYAISIEFPSPVNLLRQKLPYREVDVRYEYWIREDGGDWEAVQITIHVRKPNGQLSNGELLWRVHAACHAHLHDQDHCFFEGFCPVGESADGVPILEIVLGS